jgi:hypothetical protein
MNASALRTLEFDRIVSVVTGLAVTPPGRDRLAELHPSTAAVDVIAAQRKTTEGTRFLADHPGFPLRAPSDLDEILEALGMEGRGLEPFGLLGLAGYLESIEQSPSAITKGGGQHRQGLRCSLSGSAKQPSLIPDAIPFASPRAYGFEEHASGCSSPQKPRVCTPDRWHWSPARD